MIYETISMRRFQSTALFVAFGALALAPAVTSGQTPASLLTSRAELTAAADRAESLAASSNSGSSTKNALLAASIRQRLNEGDFQPGDRVILTIVSDARHTDTLVVRSGRVLELPGKISLPLSGVLRSELEERASTEVDRVWRWSQRGGRCRRRRARSE